MSRTMQKDATDPDQLFEGSESSVLFSSYVQKSIEKRMLASSRQELKPRVIIVSAKRERGKVANGVSEYNFKLHDVKYSGNDKGQLALSIRDSWKLKSLHGVEVEDVEQASSSSSHVVKKRNQQKQLTLVFRERAMGKMRQTMVSMGSGAPAGGGGTGSQYYLTSGEEHLRIIWYLQFLSKKYLNKALQITGVEQQHLIQWFDAHHKDVHETFETTGFGMERSKLPAPLSSSKATRGNAGGGTSMAARGANDGAAETGGPDANGDLDGGAALSAISEEELMLQEMFETYNLEFRETDMFDFLKEKLGQLEAANVTDIFQSEKKVQECVDKMEVASSRLDDFRCHMDSISVKLEHMRKDIKAIDMQNHVFNIQRKNNYRLLGKLDAVFKNSQISAETKAVLATGTLDPPHWNDTLDAIQTLMRTIEYTNGASSAATTTAAAAAAAELPSAGAWSEDQRQKGGDAGGGRVKSGSRDGSLVGFSRSASGRSNDGFGARGIEADADDDGDIHGLQRMRGVRDLNQHLVVVKNKFLGRAVPFLCNRFRSFIDKYCQVDQMRQSQLGDHQSHHKLHRRLLIYSPLMMRLHRLDRSVSERVGSAYTTKMNSLLLQESRTLIDSLVSERVAGGGGVAGGRGRGATNENDSAPYDVHEMSDDDFLNDEEVVGESSLRHKAKDDINARDFIQWVWRFVPHMVEELEFIVSFFLSDGEGNNPCKGNALPADRVDLADLLASGLFKSFSEDMKKMTTGQASSNMKLSELILMQATVKAWINHFATKDYAGILKRTFTKVHDGLTVLVSTRLQNQSLPTTISVSSVKSVHVLPAVGTTTSLLQDIANVNLDSVFDSASVLQVVDGSSKRKSKRSEAFEAVPLDARNLTVAQANNVVDAFGTPLMELLQKTAAVDKKHGDRFLLENLYALVTDVPKNANKFSELDAFIRSVQTLFDSSMSTYVNDQMNYHIMPIIKFIDLLERTMPVMDRHEIGYQQGCTRADLHKCLQTSFHPSVERVLSSVKGRIEKHFGPVTRSSTGNITNSVWAACQKELLKKIIRLEKIIGVVFVDEKISPSAHEIKEIFKAI